MQDLNWCFLQSPSSALNNDLNMLKLIDFVCKTCDSKLLLIGDFNFRDINWDNWVLQEISTRLSTENRFLASLRDNLLLIKTC